MATKKTTNETTPRKTASKRASTKKMEQRSDEELVTLDAQSKGVINNIEMLYKTITELRERGVDDKIDRLNFAQEENFSKLEMLDSSLAKEMREKYQTDSNGLLISKKSERRVNHPLDNTDSFLQIFNSTQEDIVKYDVVDSKVVDNDSFKDVSFDDVDEVYDVLNLPSNGQCYKNKKNKIAVSYLTATDENFITSPNLYRDGLITDCLLHRKIVDKTIDVDNLVAGDADAVIYFLRVSSYGADFPATFTDPETNEQFETVIDLGQIKVKDFNLIGDENGYFDFELPISKDKIKFRFLTKKDERKLERLNRLGDNSTRAVELRSITKYLETFIEDGAVAVSDDELIHLEDGIGAMTDIADRISEKEGLPINRLITNRLEMNVMSVNGNTDRDYIRKYVRNMMAKDSLMLRRYILENAPGLDFRIKVERPESLGGGFINSFLDWDDTVFLNIA